jgi:hypothetical protein
MWQQAARRLYDYSKDFPVDLQKKKSSANTILRLEFELDEKELVEFQTELGSTLNGYLPIKITIGSNDCEVRVSKPGQGGKTLNRRSSEVVAFVAKRLDFEYIPAIRTAEKAEEVVGTLVSRELMSLDTDPRYRKALDEVEKVQDSLLKTLEDSLRTTLSKFLPNVKAVQVKLPPGSRVRGWRACQIVIDDGVRTSLNHKGDGIQSLTALGVMRHASQSRSRGKNLVIAIEEPEAHLHPRAQHELRAVIAGLAKQHQVVVATHCPLFVDRSLRSSNIVVQRNGAHQAKNIAEVRDVLGVRSSDNLVNAEVVVIVEGENDIVALSSILRGRSNAIKSAIDNGDIVFDQLDGVSNLHYKVALYRNNVCRVRCFLDDDRAGRDAYLQAESLGLLEASDVVLSSVTGRNEAELEDLHDERFTARIILDKFGVQHLAVPASLKKSKWSERLQFAFKHAGRPFTHKVRSDLKRIVANEVAENPQRAVSRSRESPIESLVKSLVKDLKSI